MPETKYAKGLEGVIATESKICKIDGEKGKLYHFGYSIEGLAEPTVDMTWNSPPGAHPVELPQSVVSYLSGYVEHRVYRPKNLYTGSGEREFIPMEKR